MTESRSVGQSEFVDALLGNDDRKRVRVLSRLASLELTTSEWNRASAYFERCLGGSTNTSLSERLTAINAAVHVPGTKVRQLVTEIALHGEPSERVAASLALARAHDSSAAFFVVMAALDVPAARGDLAELLLLIDTGDVQDNLEALMEEEDDPSVRLLWAGSLGRSGTPLTRKQLAKLTVVPSMQHRVRFEPTASDTTLVRVDPFWLGVPEFRWLEFASEFPPHVLPAPTLEKEEEEEEEEEEEQEEDPWEASDESEWDEVEEQEEEEEEEEEEEDWSDEFDEEWDEQQEEAVAEDESRTWTLGLDRGANAARIEVRGAGPDEVEAAGDPPGPPLRHLNARAPECAEVGTIISATWVSSSAGSGTYPISVKMPWASALAA